MLVDENVFIQIPMYVFWKDLNCLYLGGNNAQAAGFPDPTDLIGKSDYECVWEEYADIYRAGDLATLDGVEVTNQIEPQIQIDGLKRTIMVNKSRLYNENNQVIGVVGSYTEIVDKNLTGQYKALKKNISLTEKEANCLLMLVRGYTAKEIADVFHLSVRTVNHRIDNIKRKLQCYSKAELIKKAFKLDFIQNRLLANFFLK